MLLMVIPEGKSLLRQPWEQHTYPSQCVDRSTTDGNPSTRPIYILNSVCKTSNV